MFVSLLFEHNKKRILFFFWEEKCWHFFSQIISQWPENKTYSVFYYLPVSLIDNFVDCKMPVCCIIASLNTIETVIKYPCSITLVYFVLFGVIIPKTIRLKEKCYIEPKMRDLFFSTSCYYYFFIIIIVVVANMFAHINVYWVTNDLRVWCMQKCMSFLPSGEVDWYILVKVTGMLFLENLFWGCQVA
jgi:hypothetical protein